MYLRSRARLAESTVLLKFATEVSAVEFVMSTWTSGTLMNDILFCF